jgi:hypothetical protein
MSFRTNRVTVAFSVILFGIALLQYGDRNDLNGMPFAKVQAMVADSARARRLAQQGNIDFFAGQAAPGSPTALRGELTDANCYLGNVEHGYDHAYCAKFCVAAGSPIVFIDDNGGKVYVVLTAQNGVPLPAKVLDQIGVPGVVVKGWVFQSHGIEALAVESIGS